MSRNDRTVARPLTRRDWLARSGRLMAGALGAATLAPLVVAPRTAYAADYKALVCVFLYGGCDMMNVVVPTDSRHDQYASVRGPLALPAASLAALQGVPFGLHPALSALKPSWDSGALAPVFNLGPLFKPLTKDEYLAQQEGSELIPDALFSHADQQSEWETSTSTSLTRTGWGGRASAVLGTANPVIAQSGGGGRFGLEDLRTPLVVPGPGSYFGAYGLGSQDMGWKPNRLRRNAIDALYAQQQPLVLGNAYSTQQNAAFEVSERLAAIIASLPGDQESSPEIDAAFAGLIVNGQLATDLAAQLYQVAKLIHYKAQVQGNRQVFFVAQGGYDTHSGQVDGADPTQGLHAILLQQLGDALAAFQQAMVNLGLSKKVTSFTQSDFGRTFAPNSTVGTDHAWGSHHLVLGGAVKGHATYGTYPSLVLGGQDDVGVYDWELQGRWIPTSSVDQYAATLLGWFGASASQLDQILPNLANFGSQRSLGFL